MPVDRNAFYRAAEVETSDNEEMSFRIVVSTETKGRDRLVIPSSAWELDNFRKNPTVLFNHDSDHVIGRATDIAISGKRMIATVEMAAAGTSEIVDVARKLVKQKMLRGASTGFRALEPPEYIVVDGEIQEIRINRAELYEFSLTPIPAVPDALMLARSIGASPSVASLFFRGGR